MNLIIFVSFTQNNGNAGYNVGDKLGSKKTPLPETDQLPQVNSFLSLRGKSHITELHTTLFAFERVSDTKAAMLNVVSSSIVQGLVRFKLMCLHKPANTAVSPRSLPLGTFHERKTSLVVGSEDRRYV